jgi:hypothetical protein
MLLDAATKADFDADRASWLPGGHAAGLDVFPIAAE